MSALIEREMRGGVAIVRLSRPPVNALDPDLLRAIHQELDEIERSDAVAVVLTGAGRAFSAGVDLPRLLTADAAYVEEGLSVLGESLLALFTFSRPVVAAVNGHAIAGGCILVLACDHRVAASGDSRIGVTELAVGLPFPTAPLEILRYAAGAGTQELALLADLYGPEEARARRLVDEVVAPEDLLDRAVAVAERLGRIPAASFAQTKRALRAPTVERIAQQAPLRDPDVVRLWCSEELRASVGAFLERLGIR